MSTTDQVTLHGGPFDGETAERMGVLVYQSREAAELAAEHQSEMYDLDCEVRSMARVLDDLRQSK